MNKNSKEEAQEDDELLKIMNRNLQCALLKKILIDQLNKNLHI